MSHINSTNYYFKQIYSEYTRFGLSPLVWPSDRLNNEGLAGTQIKTYNFLLKCLLSPILVPLFCITVGIATYLNLIVLPIHMLSLCAAGVLDLWKLISTPSTPPRQVDRQRENIYLIPPYAGRQAPTVSAAAKDVQNPGQTFFTPLQAPKPSAPPRKDSWSEDPIAPPTV